MRLVLRQAYKFCESLDKARGKVLNYGTYGRYSVYEHSEIVTPVWNRSAERRKGNLQASKREKGNNEYR